KHGISITSNSDQHFQNGTLKLCVEGDSYEIKVYFCCHWVGFYPATLAFEFKPDLGPSSTSFHIVRFIEAQCMGSLGVELAPVAPYKPRSLPAWTPEVNCKIVDGQPPEGYRLLYSIVYTYIVINCFFCFGLFRRALLESPLSWENYTEKMQLLLYLEELQMEVDIKKYNIPNNDKEYATMVRDPVNKKLLVLEVPGVSENRPSVLRGDKLLVCPIGEKGVKYCGYVHSVQLDSVKLGFSSKLFDSKLEGNKEQSQAVQHIVAGSSKPAPYLVFGPPGTGKTVTLVEAIKQIEKTQASCHILACAPSNSAADLLCQKILDHVDDRKVYRMYASSRDPNCVPEQLKACSNLVGECYTFPPKEELMEYRIMVTTLLTAGRLVTGGIPAGHFTHVFVDEAGHAVETECLVPLAGLLHAETGQVVLAGDPKQLGPILRSPFALKYGMGVSLLERMMNDFSLYQKDNDVFNNRYVTKLLRNYRSHPAILKIPNELFYDGELQCHADEILRNSYCNWQYLKQRGFPLIFHGVTGLDEREASSPSFFNRAEVEVLMGYVTKLLQTHSKKGLGSISPKDIGIIAPYRKQVLKIRKALEKVGKDLKLKDMNALKVGSVEEFQGQERRVILVSTVRSSPNYAEIDKKFSLGFVKNEKRFNVAVTRAKALLIVVGNPRVLNTDPTWAHFIKYCSDEGGYDGIHFTGILAEEDEDVVARLAALFIAINVQGDTHTVYLNFHQHLPQNEHFESMLKLFVFLWK
uniref:RNA helicase n=1 Tax=Lates calcarifer TaxID=8187 RepID=A0A4W6DP67_LATCA